MSRQDCGGMLVAWEALDVRDLLAAAHRHGLHLAGQELPGRNDWRSAAGTAGPADADPALPASGEPGPPDLAGRGEVMPLGSLGGQVIAPPGPGLAGWLACSGRACPAAGVASDPAAGPRPLTRMRAGAA